MARCEIRVVVGATAHIRLVGCLAISNISAPLSIEGVGTMTSGMIYSLEHLAEVLPQVVASGPLDSSARAGDVGFDRHRLVPPRELLRLRFRS